MRGEEFCFRTDCAETSRSPICYVPLNVLVNDPQLSAEDFLEFCFVLVIELSDVGIHCIESKSSKALRPFVDQIVQRIRSSFCRHPIS